MALKLDPNPNECKKIMICYPKTIFFCSVKSRDNQTFKNQLIHPQQLESIEIISKQLFRFWGFRHIAIYTYALSTTRLPVQTSLSVLRASLGYPQPSWLSPAVFNQMRVPTSTDVRESPVRGIKTIEQEGRGTQPATELSHSTLK